MRSTQSQLDDAVDALDHIVRVCDNSRTQTRRLLWIRERAACGISGNSDWQKLDLPRDKNNLVIKNRQLKFTNEQMLEALELARSLLQEPYETGLLGGNAYQKIVSAIDAGRVTA